MRKPKLMIERQVNKMVDKGIHFNIKDSNSAQSDLATKTYLYKIFYYRKNFHKNNDNKYNLEYAYLSDLASIDMKIRYTLLHMCLDIEHSLKVVLNNYISEDPSEDGYEIIQDFIKETGVSLDRIFSNKMNKRTKQVNSEFKKYYDDPPYWVCLELMSYGVFVNFVEYYYSRNPVQKLKFASSNIKYAKNTRNLATHNSVLIVPLLEKKKLPISLHGYLSSKNIFLGRWQSRPLIDIAAVISLHNKYCSEGLKKYRKLELEAVKERYNRNIEYYANYNDISTFFKNISTIIDNYNS